MEGAGVVQELSKFLQGECSCEWGPVMHQWGDEHHVQKVPGEAWFLFPLKLTWSLENLSK
jgi:hypothetical protein